MLGPASDRRKDLLGVGRGEHEDDVVAAVPRASSRARSRPRPKACGPRRRCRPSSVPVSRATPGRRGHASRPRRCWTQRPARARRRRRPGAMSHARLAGPARLAVDRSRAVQRLGDDPRRRGLARAARPGEEVGVGHPVVADSVAEGVHHVVLTPHLLEALRAIAPVERLVIDHHPRLGLGGGGLRCRRMWRVSWPQPGPGGSSLGPSASMAGMTRAGTGVSSTSALLVRSIPWTSSIRSRTSAR